MSEQQQVFEFDSHRNIRRYLNKEYFNLPDDTKKKVLIAWRADKKIKVIDVLRGLDIHEGQYYEELDRLGIERKRQPRKKKLASAKKTQSSCVTSFFKGTIDPIQLQDEFTRIAISLDESAYQYRYSIELEKINEDYFN